jgi:hypothetical protein
VGLFRYLRVKFMVRKKKCPPRPKYKRRARATDVMGFSWAWFGHSCGAYLLCLRDEYTQTNLAERLKLP